MNIQVVSAETFRQTLAGFIDPNLVLPDEEREETKQAAIRFCSILPTLFGDDLDRKTLWERIGNGLKVCVAKCGGDWESFVSEILEYIKSDGGRVAASKPLADILDEIKGKPRAWKDGWFRVMETKNAIIIVYARALWNSTKRPKELEVEEKPAADGFVDEIPGGTR